MNASRPVRWTVARRLVELLGDQAAAASVEVAGYWPGDNLPPELVWLAPITGDTDIPVSTGSRLHVDDMFVLTFEIRIAGFSDPMEAGARCEEVMGLVHDVAVAALPELEDMPGVVDVQPGDMDGPLVMETPSDGCLALASYPVLVHSRLT